jgi:hypothetical protein
MLSLDQCRQILGPECQLTDGELEQLRDELYALADIALTSFLELRERSGSPTPASCGDGHLPSDVEGKTPEYAE